MSSTNSPILNKQVAALEIPQCAERRVAYVVLVLVPLAL